MKRLLPLAIVGALALLPLRVPAAEPLSHWKHVQSLTVPQPGLVKISLPADTLGAARPGFEDVRVVDDRDREVPCLMQPTVPAERELRRAKSLNVSLSPAATVLTIETGITQPIEAIVLEVPDVPFLKAVRVEGSADRTNWQVLADGIPIFRQAHGVAQTELALPRATWPFLRLTMDDRRSDPVPFSRTAVPWLRLVAAEMPAEKVPVTVTALDPVNQRSRWRLQLPNANLRLAALQFETAAPLFTRHLTLSARRVTEAGVEETLLAHGTIFRLGVAGQPTSSNLTLAVEARVPTSELVLEIEDGDSPPLEFRAITATRRPDYLVFHAARAGAFRVLTGNSLCAAPSYDLAQLGANLAAIAPASLTLLPLADNPAYRPPTPLPAVADNGAPLDTAGWRFRKLVTLARAGAQELELDLDVLAHAQPGFGDLRLLRGSNQVPFLVERAVFPRTLAPAVSLASLKDRPRVARWVLKLPHAGLPVTRLTCTSPTPLFRREMTLLEEVRDARGAAFPRILGSASWMQQPGAPAGRLTLDFTAAPTTDSVFLEADNGDNPAIVLANFEFTYSISRLVFKSETADGLHLYYGNAEVAAPQYDLRLVAAQLAVAGKAQATAGAEERLVKASWREQFGGAHAGRPVLWVVLAAVVVALLVIITRLLPKAPALTGDDDARPPG